MKLQDLEPYLKRVNLFLDGQGVPNREILEKIRAIYDVVLKDKALPQTTLGCASCVTKMFNHIKGAALRGEIKKKAKKEVDGWFKGIKEENEKVFEKIEKESSFDASKLADYLEDGAIKLIPSEMKWGELKTYAKEKGINTKGMKKVDILKELGIA